MPLPSKSRLCPAPRRAWKLYQQRKDMDASSHTRRNMLLTKKTDRGVHDSLSVVLPLLLVADDTIKTTMDCDATPKAHVRMVSAHCKVSACALMKVQWREVEEGELEPLDGTSGEMDEEGKAEGLSRSEGKCTDEGAAARAGRRSQAFFSTVCSDTE